MPHLGLSNITSIPYCQVQHAFVVGGHKNGCGCEIREPTSVSFSPSGELLICDSGFKHILILSSNMHCLKKLRVPFVSNVPKDSIPSAYHKFPAAPPYDKPLDTGEELSDGVSTRDVTPVSVSVSVDGKIAVMYKRGGIIVYRPHKQYDVGSFEYMMVRLLCELSDCHHLILICLCVMTHHCCRSTISTTC